MDIRGDERMKRYTIHGVAASQGRELKNQPYTACEDPEGLWVKWEDMKSLLTFQEIEILDDIIGMYRQEFGTGDYRYEEAKKVIDKLRGRI